MIKRFIVAAIAAIGLAGVAQADAINQTTFGGVAIDGYDTVAYFTDGRPVEGVEAHESDWNGATWRFASAANKALFDADPEKYAPQYGGYCAFAASKNAIADVDPEAWAVVDDKLYLNYSLNVQEIWREDVPGNITKADANWPGLKAEL